MSRKIAILFVTLGLALGVGGYAALKTTVFPTFVEFEQDAARRTLERAGEMYRADLKGLEIMNIEYSAWDQTYDYVNGLRPEYLRESMDPEYWHSVDTHLMMIFDAGGQLLYGSLIHPTDGSRLNLDAAFESPLEPDHPLVNHADEESAVSGLVRTRLGIMLVVSYPILKSDGNGPIAGSLVSGQLLTDEKLAEYSRRLSAELIVHSMQDPVAGTRTAAALDRLAESDAPLLIDGDEYAMRTYTIVRDILDQPIGLLEVITSREISAIGAATIRAAGWSLGAAGAFFLLTALLFTNRSIVAPIGRLTDKILKIRETGDLSIEIDDHGRDEVGLLASEFRALTQRLGESQRELEAARDDALELARTKSEFLARMSHEIRTPMNGVLGMTELLRDTPLNPKQQRFARTIHDSALSLLDIINDILDFSKIESGKLRLDWIDVDLQELLEETVESVATSAAVKGIELINQTRLGLDTAVRTDPGRLRQVLTNLLANAIKFTDEGEVVLMASVSDADGGKLRIDFEVRDTGIGIKPEKQKIIFDSFTQEDGSTTRNYGGTGLGLAICRQLIEMMNGELSVQSEPGAGSTFAFTLVMEKGRALETRSQKQLTPIAGRRILVVDDNATNREILEQQLGGWRALTETADSAQAGLERLAAARAAGTPFDLAILDIHMPGTDGIELAESIRANDDYRDLKLVILSSIAESIGDDQVAALDISAQLAKPVRQSDLYDALFMVLAGEEAAASLSRSKLREARALSGTILLAEDNAVNRMVAAGMLESMGLDVIMARDGDEAVRQAANDEVDLILMDCQMPETDGFEATRMIREREAAEGLEKLPIIALTANALKGDRERCLDAGMDEYLSKPFTSEQLHAVLSGFLGDRPVAAAEANTEATVVMDDRHAASKPAVDRRALQALAELQQPHDDEFVASVVAAFCEGAEESRARMSEAVAAQDAARIADIAHGLKSSSANVGATVLSSICAQLETQVREDRLKESSELHEIFEREMARVLEVLRTDYLSVTP
ncbi:MAG: response regulator [Woeseiaceae bacterium]|nr:response regulator [Woeseiaceae bacterium]